MKIEIIYTEKELSNEVWKSIPHYDGIYEVSNLGRIRTCEGKTTYTKRHGKRVWKQRILHIKYCYHKLHPKRIDGRVNLWKDGKPKTLLVSKITLSSFDKTYDLFATNITVNHIDGNSLNNRIENLEWCSIQENIKKGFQQGLFSSCNRIKVINKNTKEEKIFYSQEEASRFMGKYRGYITEKKYSRNPYEDKNYKWEILK